MTHQVRNAPPVNNTSTVFMAINALFIAELKHVRDALPAELRTPKRVATPRSTPKSKPNASKPSSKTAREAAAGVDAESDAVFDTPKKLKIDP